MLSEDLQRHFDILACYYDTQERKIKLKKACLEAIRLTETHHLQQNCQHEDDGGFMFGCCKKCGIDLG